MLELIWYNSRRVEVSLFGFSFIANSLMKKVAFGRRESQWTPIRGVLDSIPGPLTFITPLSPTPDHIYLLPKKNSLRNSLAHMLSASKKNKKTALLVMTLLNPLEKLYAYSL